MQANNKDKKKKYVMEDFISTNRANPVIQSYNTQKQILTCLCGSHDFTGLKCFKCGIIVHGCLAKKNNREFFYECSSCLSKALDPLIQIKRVLVQSYFKTYSIFDYSHNYNFEFTLGPQDLSCPVEIRGLVPDNTGLAWPMQGAFYLNDDKNCIHQLKPLLLNSNRKSRRQQFFSIGSDKLKLGRNYVRFKIPCLDRAKYTPLYQHEQKRVYYMSINLTVRLTAAELQTQTFRQRRIEKIDSLKILQINNADIQITSNTVCLICPYTKERIKVPVRGKYCKHFTCICLQTLIVTHSSSRGWGCPICQNRMNEPYVDVWFYNMLKDNQKGQQVNIKEDGSYQWIQKSQEAMSIEDDSSPIPFTPAVHVISNILQNAKKVVKQQINIQIQENIIQSSNINKIKQTGRKIDKIPNAPNQQKKPPQNNKTNAVDVIMLDDSQQQNEINLRKKGSQNRKNLVSKLKSNPKDVSIQDKRSQHSKQIQQDQRKDIKKRQKQDIRSIPIKPKAPLITDIPLLQMRELRIEEFKKAYLRNKTNNYKKYIQNEQMKRIFKEII